MRWDRNELVSAMEWDGTEKYVPRTSLLSKRGVHPLELDCLLVAFEFQLSKDAHNYAIILAILFVFFSDTLLI